MQERSGAKLLFSFIAVTVAMLCLTARASADWFGSTDVGLIYEDNLSHAVARDDQKTDTALSAHAAIGQFFQVTDSSTLSLTFDAGGNLYFRFEELNNASAGLSASYKYKFGLGSFAPWAAASGSAAYTEYNEEERSGFAYAAGLSAGKRIHERVNLQASYTYENRNAENTVFNLEGNTYMAKADILIFRNVQLSLGYGLRKGDLAIYYSTSPYTPPPYAPPRPPYYPPGYGGGYGYSPGDVFTLNTFDTTMAVARYHATTHIYTASLSIGLSNSFSINVGADRYESRAAGMFYPDNVVRGGIVYTF